MRSPSATIREVILHARAILFDMDGTLVDSSAIIRRAWRWWAARHCIPVDPILAVEKGRPNREIMTQFTRGLDLDTEGDLFLRFEENDIEGLEALPGAAEAVRNAASGPWAIVTSAHRSLAEIRLRAASIPLPEIFITADEITRDKPDPQCFLLAAGALKVAPAECLVFEDSPAGIMAGQCAGMQVIGVCGAGAEHHSDVVIDDFRGVSIARNGAGFHVTIGGD